MIDLGRFDEFTCEEMLAIKGLPELAASAMTAANLIQRVYKIKEERIEILYFNGEYEYLTRDNVWQARYKDWSYDVKCTPDGIFDLYKKAFLARRTSNMLLDNASEHFKHFVIRTYHHMQT